MSVQLALTPDTRWEFSTAELAAAAGAAGFTALGAPADRVDDDSADVYAAAGLRCHEVLALLVGNDERAAVAAAEDLARRADAIGADWVLTVFAAPVMPPVVARCAKAFDGVGAGMAVEFSPLGPVATLTDGMAVVSAAHAGGRAGLMIDSWHFCVGDNTWDDLAAVALDDIAYVQFADALRVQPGRLMRDTLHRRALPGDGVLDLDRFAGTLRDRGYEGVVSAEVLSAELRALPATTLAHRIYDAMAPYWGGIR